MLRVLIFLFVCFPFTSSASEIIELDWKQLRPEVSRTTVLPQLNYQQMVAVQELYSLMGNGAEGSADRISELKQQLKTQNLDADELFELRDKYMKEAQIAAETITSAYDGQQVRIPGFLVPVEFSSPLLATQFLLVPVAGACIHMPPPPANQIIYVSYPEGYKVETVQYPVWVEGKINSSLRSDNVYLVDGEANVTMGYTMDASMVEDYL